MNFSEGVNFIGALFALGALVYAVKSYNLQKTSVAEQSSIEKKRTQSDLNRDARDELLASLDKVSFEDKLKPFFDHGLDVEKAQEIYMEFLRKNDGRMTPSEASEEAHQKAMVWASTIAARKS